MDFDSVKTYLRQQLEDYHEWLMRLVDEQVPTHILLCFALSFTIPHIWGLLWLPWLHYFLVVFSAPFRTGWWN